MIDRVRFPDGNGGYSEANPIEPIDVPLAAA